MQPLVDAFLAVTAARFYVRRLFFAGEGVADGPVFGPLFHFPIDLDLCGAVALVDEAFEARRVGVGGFAEPHELVVGPAGGCEFADAAEVVVDESDELLGGGVEAPVFGVVEDVGRQVVVAFDEPGAVQVGREGNLRFDLLAAGREYSRAGPFALQRGESFDFLL